MEHIQMVMARRQRNHAHYEKNKADRIKDLAKFPIDSEVVWIHSPGAVLTVVGHDTKLGRVKTSNGVSYVPGELEKAPTK